MNFRVITNNPKVYRVYAKTCLVEYQKVSYQEVLLQVRHYVQQGCRILSHPLSGSVKPGEMPYKSIMISSQAAGIVDMESELLIEQCLAVCNSFSDEGRRWPACVLDDFQYIDYTLIASAVESARSLG